MTRLPLLLTLVSVVWSPSSAAGLEVKKSTRIDSKVLLGMRIDKAHEGDAGISVVTTGAEFLLGNRGRIRCFQRIPARREVAGIQLPEQVLPLSWKQHDEFTCVVSGRGIELTVQGDSLVIFKASEDIKLGLRGLFRPAYHAQKDGNRLFIDGNGGFGVYPVRRTETKDPDLEKSPWDVDYEMNKGDEIWFSVFPARPYNRQRSFESIAHEGNVHP